MGKNVLNLIPIGSMVSLFDKIENISISMNKMSFDARSHF
jgi:hypothetical protein